MLKFREHPLEFLKNYFFQNYFPLKNFYKKYLPKRNKANSKYLIISAVYNVEKYLDDFFCSIINQRLNFKNNICIICVDDGSSDGSAEVIKKYQAKFPENIIYIYKNNSGQASARNLGIEYAKNHSLKADWVTFTDPDDFLDINYFYKIDGFLKKNKNNDLSMIGCNIIFYDEGKKYYVNNHPLKFKFKNKILLNHALGNNIQLATNSAFLKFDLIKEERFNEKIFKFEDAHFLNVFLLNNPSLKSAFLKSALYYYRKRSNGTSTLDSIKESDYLGLLKNGYLNLLNYAKERAGNIPDYIQNIILYDLFWMLKESINTRKFTSFSVDEKLEFQSILKEIYFLIDNKNIINFNLCKVEFIYKVGILGCFKNVYPSWQIVFIEDYDRAQNQLKIKYFTPNKDDKEIFKSKDLEFQIAYRKIVEHNFMEQVFCYEKNIWLQLDYNSKSLEIYINSQKAKIDFNKEQYDTLLLQKLYDFYPKFDKNIWLLCDKDIVADDNAEHFYRYLKQNHSEIKAYFALRKSSPDYERLKKEGFNLVSWGSLKFMWVYKKADKIISSHIDKYITNYMGLNLLKGKKFVFLQHGIIKDDLSSWLNTKKIDLFITSTKAEFHSIKDDFNHYKFGEKEVVLSGLARHDALLKNNQFNNKKVLIMPTWREYLATNILGSAQKNFNNNFLNSNYFKIYKDFLYSSKLQKLAKKYNYTFIFSPHPHMRLADFDVPSYIDIFQGSQSMQRLFESCDLLITDYSSVAFEMAYLGKPSIYYQFDENEFFAKHSYKKGYFDYRKDGFGPVVTNQKKLFDELEKLLNDNCKVSGLYKSNIKNTFEFQDGKCCERIYDKIVNLDKK